MAFNMQESSRLFGIFPNSRGFLTAWDMASDDIKRKNIDRQFVIAADGIKWAIATARVSGTVEIVLRKMSTYQTLKTLVDVANNVSTMNDVPAYLNKSISGQGA